MHRRLKLIFFLYDAENMQKRCAFFSTGGKILNLEKKNRKLYSSINVIGDHFKLRDCGTEHGVQTNQFTSISQYARDDLFMKTPIITDLLLLWL